MTTITDRITVILIALALPIILIMSAANVYATLINTGEPVFLDTFAAYFLSALAPTTSIALKVSSKFFTSTKQRNNYEKTIFFITAISFFLWCVLYAAEYGTAVSDVTLSFDDEETSYMGLLTFFQLFTEILVGTALFIGLENILKKTEHEAYRLNAKWLQAKKVMDENTTKRDELIKERNSILLTYTLHDEERKTHINNTIAKYLQLRERALASGDSV